MSKEVDFMGRRGWRVGLWVMLCGVMALGSTLPVLCGAPQDSEKQSKAEKRRQKARQKELETPYKKWIDEEVGK